MKTPRLYCWFTALLIVCTSAGAQPEGPANPPGTPPRAPTTPAPDVVAPVIPPSDSNVSGTVAVKTASEQTWESIRDHTFEEREQFMSGLKGMEEQMQKSIEALKERRATFTGDPSAWDSEMKRLDDARTYLKSMSTQLAKATAVNWVVRRDDVARAWDRLQAAYARASGLVTP